MTTQTGLKERAKSRPLNLSRALTYDIPQMRLYLVNEARGKKPWPTITSAEDAARLLKPLSHASEEHFVSLHLNAKFEVIGLHEVSHGTLSASLVHPREVFKAALVANSYAILVCHNHPSGAKLAPSTEDMETTRQLVRAGRVLGVSVLDHIIVGLEDHASDHPNLVNEHYSLRQEHPELWLSD
jgi:DNA repair protein RadC